MVAIERTINGRWNETLSQEQSLFEDGQWGTGLL